jgi:hypothetical protein
MTDQTLKDIDRAFKALEERDELLDKIRTEIDEQYKWLLKAGCDAYKIDIAFGAIKAALRNAVWIQDRVAESEVNNG